MNDEGVEKVDWERKVTEEILIERKFEKKKEKNDIQPEQIIHKVEEVSGIVINEIYGNSRKRQISN